MDYVFNQCVDFLVWLAALLGLTYNEINVWIFCIIWPLITLSLIGNVIYSMHWRGKVHALVVSLLESGAASRKRIEELEGRGKGPAGPIMLRFNYSADDFNVESWCVCSADKWVTLKADFIKAIDDGDFAVPFGAEEINFGSAEAFLACIAETPITWGGIMDIEDKHPGGKVWGKPVDVVKVMENAVAWAAQ